MGNRYSEIVFTPSVKQIQESRGSRRAYARLEGAPDSNATLGEDEAQFIALRDSFYLGSTSETGWPYVQHRGGPVGFLKVLDDRTIGFGDFRGNRQYVSAGNIAVDDRVALILMDYPHRSRLKLLGHARSINADETELLGQLRVPGHASKVEGGVLIAVVAFDWNCPQYITPRYTEDEIGGVITSLEAKIASLEGRLARQHD
jgi:predicted pyridoxine 5'-phosphate oxidase superfamily flavin-nucleotide-binding protein